MANEKILIVDDEEDVCHIIACMLATQGFETATADGPERALESLAAFRPALVLTDIKMPGTDGLELARQIKEVSPDTSIITITGYASIDSAIQSLRAGVDDYIKKPIELGQLVTAVRSALGKRATTLRNKKYVEELHCQLARAKQTPASSFLGAVKGLFRAEGQVTRGAVLDTVESLAIAMGAKDAVTKDHSRQVGAYASRMAEFMSISPDIVGQFRLAGLLHDVGKIAIPQYILDKVEAERTPEERETFRQHPMISLRILQPVREFEPILDAVLHHHERFDGKGYPNGLSGASIPVGARVIAVADSFAKTRSEDSSDDIPSEASALECLIAERGKMLDPEMVDVFLQVLLSIKEETGGEIHTSNVGKIAIQENFSSFIEPNGPRPTY